MKHSIDDTLSEVLAQCTDMISAGEPITACLHKHPEHAASLAPLLAMLVSLGSLRPVPARQPEIAARSRAEFMAAAQRLPASTAVSGRALAAWWAQISRSWRELIGGLAATLKAPRLPHPMPAGLLAILLIFVLSGILITGTLSVAARAMPGDLLFPVKTAAEDIRLFIARDPGERLRLQAENAQRRIDELRTVRDAGRMVPRMSFRGVIEKFDAGHWQVSGITILLTAQSQLEGEPWLGARVEGAVHAPGDGTLVALYLEVEPLPAGKAVTPEPALPTATRTPPSRVPPTSTATATVTPAPTMAEILGPVPPATQAVAEPTDEPTQAPTPTPTATQTPRPTATRTPTVQPTPTAPASTPSREKPRRYFEGTVVRIVGAWWTIGEITVETTADTIYIGNPGVGSRVGVTIEVQPSGAAVALIIQNFAAPEATPEPFEFTGVIAATGPDVWRIGDYDVRVTSSTRYINSPAAGDTATVKALRYPNGTLEAVEIAALRDPTETQFSGTIESIGADAWVISGITVTITGETQITGVAPAVGLTAEVVARETPAGQVIALIINVRGD